MESQLQLAPLKGALPHVEEIQFHPFPCDNPDNEKGSRTWNWLHPETVTRGRTMVACRKQGEAVGGHFHPRVPTKDPERFLLIVGNVRFWFKDLHGMGRLIETNADVHGPIEILVPPYILHHITIVSEVAWFLEQQTDVFDPDINYNEAEFNLLAQMCGQD